MPKVGCFWSGLFKSSNCLFPWAARETGKCSFFFGTVIHILVSAHQHWKRSRCCGGCQGRQCSLAPSLCAGHRLGASLQGARPGYLLVLSVLLCLTPARAP